MALLDSPGIERIPYADALALASHERIADALDWLATDTVHLHRGTFALSARTDAPRAPFGLLVLGDLSIDGDLVYDSGKPGEVSVIVVDGDLRARHLLYRGGAILVVTGNVTLDGTCFGIYGGRDMAADMWVGGTMSARGVILDDSTELEVTGALSAPVLTGHVSAASHDVEASFNDIETRDQHFLDAACSPNIDTGQRDLDFDKAARLALANKPFLRGQSPAAR